MVNDALHILARHIFYRLADSQLDSGSKVALVVVSVCRSLLPSPPPLEEVPR